MTERETARHDSRRWLAWGLSWLAYASYYTGRKGLSVTKKTLHDGLGVSEAALGAIDTAYLTAYSLGQFLSGVLGDRVGARRLIGAGMLASAAACLAFGASGTALAFGVFFCVNGLAQSTGWPGTTRAMAEWTTLTNRGTVMAFWATCYQVGGIVATALAAFLLGRHGWRAAFVGPAVWLALVGLAVWLFLPAPPPERAVVASGSPRGAAELGVLKNPVLWCYGASYFAIKFIRYALLFWLPYFLAKKRGFGQEQAGYVSVAFEVGGIAGVIFLGVASDRLRRLSRSVLAAAGLIGLAGALVLYGKLDASSTLANVVGLALIGAALFGPDALLSGAAAQDAGGPRAAATATGFVNGLGSIGSVLEGVLVPVMSKRYGWESVFQSFVWLALLAVLCLVPTFWLGERARAVGN